MPIYNYIIRYNYIILCFLCSVGNDARIHLITSLKKIYTVYKIFV